MWYENYITTNKEDFKIKLTDISGRLGVDPNWLMFVMRWESGVNPAAVNRQSGATGLIQFMPATAKSLGTTTEALRTMSNVKQLDYVYKYFSNYAGRMQSLYDVYLVTFFPAALGKPDAWIMQTQNLSAGVIAAQNPGIDINKDRKITVGEFKYYIDLKKKDLLTPQ